MRSVKKVLAIASMISMLSMSFIGTTAKAEDKISSTTINISGQSQESTNENKTNEIGSNLTIAGNSNTTDGNKSTISTNNVSEKSPSNANNKDNKNETASKGTEMQEKEVLPAWKSINGKLYYVTKDGILKKSGWFKEKEENKSAANDNVYYFDKDYSAAIGWKQIDNSWYYFDENGIKQTGWKLVNYEWYYLDKDGVMQKGWLKDKGNKYYLNDEGHMVLGKKYIDNKWYFFAMDGSLQTGFYGYKGKTYFSDSDGVMVANEWVKTKTYKYYVKADSSIATGYTIINNEAENFDSNGRYVGPTQMKDHLFIKYLNVGNADCEFIKLPSGETVLIDTGTPETSKKVIDFLKEQNLKQEDNKGVIDYVVITHGHSDHIGGLTSVLENFKVNKVYIPEIAKMKDWYSSVPKTEKNAADIEMMKLDYEIYNKAVKAMDDKNIKFTNTKKGEFIDKGKILQFVQSDKDFGGVGAEEITKSYWALNNNSAVIYLNYGDLQGLFTADIMWDTEKDFWTNDLLGGKKVNLLKVPHHGSSTSSTPDFLTYLKAPVGIITRAQGNDNQNTAYNNLLSNGVSIYKTGTKDEGISVYATLENWTVQQ